MGPPLRSVTWAPGHPQPRPGHARPTSGPQRAGPHVAAPYQVPVYAAEEGVRLDVGKPSLWPAAEPLFGVLRVRVQMRTGRQRAKKRPAAPAPGQRRGATKLSPHRQPPRTGPLVSNSSRSVWSRGKSPGPGRAGLGGSSHPRGTQSPGSGGAGGGASAPKGAGPRVVAAASRPRAYLVQEPLQDMGGLDGEEPRDADGLLQDHCEGGHGERPRPCQPPVCWARSEGAPGRTLGPSHSPAGSATHRPRTRGQRCSSGMNHGVPRPFRTRPPEGAAGTTQAGAQGQVPRMAGSPRVAGRGSPRPRPSGSENGDPPASLTLEQVVLRVHVGVVSDDVEGGAPGHHLEHQDAQRPPVHAEPWREHRPISPGGRLGCNVSRPPPPASWGPVFPACRAAHLKARNPDLALPWSLGCHPALQSALDLHAHTPRHSPHNTHS